MKSIQKDKFAFELKNLLTPILGAIILLLICLFIWQMIAFEEQKNELNSELANLEDNYEFLLGEKQKLDTNLNLEINRSTNLETEKETLTQELSTLNESVNETLKKIDYYQEEIDKSMGWFNKNSYLDANDPTQKEIMRKLHYASSYYEYKDSNPKKDYNDCTIYTQSNQVNIAQVNEQKFFLKYEWDVNTSKKQDYLQSISSFLENKKGDCEDWALLFVAELRHVYDECKQRSPNIKFEYNYKINEFNNFYVVCGTYFIYDKFWNILDENSYGHCNVLLTNKKISSIQDLNSIISGTILEAQTGSINPDELTGYIIDDYIQFNSFEEDDFGKIFLEKKRFVCEYWGCYSVDEEIKYTTYILDTVITENDLFYLSKDYSEWLSYSGLKKELEEKELSLRGKIKD